ncbi:FKBP-type peptidyl-prolyl cis-trans isomerase, partial [Raoultella ornithinolytica]|uniref:FKBP-type peptidyl-prolyl cis-trans isomerase n=1 Tax=Raoultella ornithinolytica TaxID=54291 RepID=UPI0034D7807E
PIHKSEQKDALVELDAQGLLPEFRENLLGKKGGEHLEFTVTYPEDFGNAELKGRAATFSLDVKGVRERRVRDLDDAFASEVIGIGRAGSVLVVWPLQMRRGREDGIDKL